MVNTQETSITPSHRGIGPVLLLSPIAGPLLIWAVASARAPYAFGAVLWGVAAALWVAWPDPSRKLLSGLITGIAAGLLACAGGVIVLLIALANCDGCLS